MNFRHIKKGDGIKIMVLGDNQTIKLTGKDTDGQFTLIEQFDEPGVGIPPHIHYDEDELFFIIEGAIEYTISGEKKIGNEGDVVFFPRGISHSWEVIGNSKARTLLTIVPAGLEIMFLELSKLDKGFNEIEKIIEITDKYNIKFVF